MRAEHARAEVRLRLGERCLEGGACHPLLSHGEDCSPASRTRSKNKSRVAQKRRDIFGVCVDTDGDYLPDSVDDASEYANEEFLNQFGIVFRSICDDCLINLW